MTQNIRVICKVGDIQGNNSGTQFGFTGYFLDGTLDFGTGHNGPLTAVIDPTEPDLQTAIAAAVQAVLEASPWNKTFAANDIIRFI